MKGKQGEDNTERTSQLANISVQSHLQATYCSTLHMHGVHEILIIMSLLEVILSSRCDEPS